MSAMMKTFHDDDYEVLLQDQQWKLKRKQILIRDNHRCKRCGSDNSLQVHHRQYQRTTLTGEYLKPWDYDAQNLVTLCTHCHKTGHQNFKVPVFFV
jgi:5-methylcytosine-specific restriction endonuclease McrA